MSVWWWAASVFFGGLIGGAGVVAVAVFWPFTMPEVKEVEPEAAPEVDQKFGHKFNPMGEVRGGVHKPPVGHFWELGVTHDAEGERWLVLRCVQFQSSLAVDERRVSLDVSNVGRPWSTRYSEEERDIVAHPYRGSRPSYVAEAARKEIVDVLTEWSRRTFLKHSTDPGALVDSVVIA